MKAILAKLPLSNGDKTLLCVAALVATICLGVAWSLGGQYYELMAMAQEPTTDVPLSSILGQVNGTIIAISGLMATAISIVSGLIAWLRAKTGDKVISNDTNEWLQWLFEQLRQTDMDVKKYVAELTAKGSEFDVVVEVLKNASSGFKDAYETAAPEIKKKLDEAKITATEWQEELDKIYEVSPKSDPVNA